MAKTWKDLQFHWRNDTFFVDDNEIHFRVGFHGRSEDIQKFKKHLGTLHFNDVRYNNIAEVRQAVERLGLRFSTGMCPLPGYIEEDDDCNEEENN